MLGSPVSRRQLVNESKPLQPIILQAWLTLPSCLASSRSPTLARNVLQSAEAGRFATPNRSAPRLGLRFAVGSRTPHVRLNLS